MASGDVLRLTRRQHDRTEVWMRIRRRGDGGAAAGVYVPKVHRHVYPRAYDVDRLPHAMRVSAAAVPPCAVFDHQAGEIGRI